MSKCALLGLILYVAELRSTMRTAKRLLHASATSMTDFVAGLPVAALDDLDADMRRNSLMIVDCNWQQNVCNENLGDREVLLNISQRGFEFF